MKPSLLFRVPEVAALVATAVLIVATGAQAPQGPPVATGSPLGQAPAFPVPTNLKVLPRQMTGEQVHNLMELWSASVGAECNACHAEDREKIGPDGRPPLNFAADSKPMKAVARTMFTMTEEINTKYVAHIDNSGMPVTCGTCHRGHMEPEAFAPALSREGNSNQPPLNSSVPEHQEETK